MKLKRVLFLIFFISVLGFITYATKPSTVRVKIENNCGRAVKLRVVHEGGALSETFIHGEVKEYEVSIDAWIEADSKQIHKAANYDRGRRIKTCN